MKDLRGANAILTGGSRGIGPYIGRALAREGVNVALAARSTHALTQAAQVLTAFGVRACAIPTDLSDPAARVALLERAEFELGPIDILINNASIAQAVPFACQTFTQIVQMIETNLVAPLMLTRLIVPKLLQRGRGHVVTIGSLNGKKGAPFFATHSATKAALIEWTAALRNELHGTGVSASVVCPGLVSKAGWWATRKQLVPRLLGASPPERVAAAVVGAIRHDWLEVMVNRTPVRPALALNALAPQLMSALVRRLGYVEFVRRISNDQLPEE